MRHFSATLPVPVASRAMASKCFFKRSEISIVIRFDMVYNRKYAY